jgi:hypothetical protein
VNPLGVVAPPSWDVAPPCIILIFLPIFNFLIREDEIFWCFVLILSLYNKLMWQLLNGVHKTPPLCTVHIEDILIYIIY